MQAIDQQQSGQQPSWSGLLLFQRILNKLAHFGVSESMPNLEKIRVRIFNHATIIVFIGSFIDAVESIIHQESGALIILSFSVSTLLVLFLSYRGLNIAARLYLTAFIPSFIFLFFPLFGGSLSLCFTYFAFMIAILIGYEDRRVILLNVLYVLGLFLMSLTYTFAGDGIFKETTDHVDTIINVSITMLIISWSIFQFLRGLIAQEKILNTQKAELVVKNSELVRILQQNEIKTELLAMVAREIKKPAESFKSSARKMLQLLEKNKPFEVLSLATKMEQTGESLFFHLDHLIRWVLAQNDQLEVSTIDFDAEETIMTIVKNLNFLIEEKKVTVRFEPFEQPFIHTDKEMFSIVMQHLIHNVIHFTGAETNVRIAQNFTDTDYIVAISSEGVHVNNELFQTIQKGLPINLEKKKDTLSYGFQISLYLAQMLGGDLVIQSEMKDRIDLLFHLPRDRAEVDTSHTNIKSDSLS